MNTFVSINSVIDSIEDFLNRSYSELQGRIFLKNRINEIGAEMNQIFDGTAKNISVDTLNKELFSIALRLKTIINMIPNGYPKIQGLFTSLLYFVLNNYFYSSTTEESHLNSIAVGLSTVLSGLPEPSEFWPEDIIDELEYNELVTASKSYNSVMTLYFTLFSKVLYEKKEVLFGWAEKYFHHDDVLYRIDKRIFDFNQNLFNIEKLMRQYDLIVTHSIYVAEFSLALFASVVSPAELSEIGLERDTVTKKIKRRLDFADITYNSIIEKINQGKINKNDHPENLPSFVMTKIAREHAEVMYLTSIRFNFEGIRTEEGLSLLKKLEDHYLSFVDVHERNGIPLANSPFTPAVMNISVNIFLLSHILKKPPSVDILSDFHEVTKESFELHLIYALTHSSEITPEFTAKLKEIPAIVTCNMTSALVLHELLLTSSGQQQFENLVENLKNLRDEVMNYGEDNLALSLHVYIDYLITARDNDVSISWSRNFFDPKSCIDSFVLIEGRSYKIFPFSTELSLRRGIFREIGVQPIEALV